MTKLPHKKILVIFLIFISGIFLVGLTILIVNFPQYYPDYTLLIEGRVIDFFHEITLPIKIAQLTLREADSELLMPVYGSVVSGVADTWNSPRGNDRIHEGQDIFARKGTPVFSATDGYVIRIRKNSDLGGNNVSIIGSGGIRYYYAHMDRFADNLKVGAKVTTDIVIGFVGNTGNAERTPNHLHFGTYLLRKAVNPLPLLIDRPR